MLKKFSLVLLLVLSLSLLVAACGDATPTANTSTTTSTAPTTSAATTAVATTAAATSAPTTAAATTVATTTAATSAPTTAAATSANTLTGNPNLKGEITVWSWNIAAKSLAQNVDGFNKLYPNVKVKVEEYGHSDVDDKFTTGLAAGGTGLPDVVTIEGTRLELVTTRFPDGLADLTDKASKYEKDFDPAKWAQSKVGGKVRSIPWDSGPVGLFYRVDMFEKAGVDPSKIETWDDYIEAGTKVQAANPGVKMLGIDFAHDDGLFRALLNQQGAFYYTPDGKINLTSKEAVTAMTIIQKLNKAGLLYNTDGWDSLVGANKNGQVATSIEGVWWSGTLTSEAPDLKGKWDAILMPAITKGGPRASNLGGSTLAIPKATKNLDAAWAFVEYNLATKDAQNNMLKNYGLWPSYLPAYSDAFYSAPQPYFNNKPIWKMFTEEVPLLKPAYFTSDFDKGQQVSNDAQAAVLSGTDPAAALQKAADSLKQQTGREIAH